ncbi:MAG: TetR/AcrR family transcriptional regulator [Spirochaetales bacterium]|jgi:AcrR family transcriptional regulator|nr:TetR/AcrR family transcriptional regulator [Spirochaetales bacterium]
MSRIVKTPEERKLEIIQTAEKLFRENGYSKISVESIIKEMGVAKGTFYYYFKSKEDVLEAIVDYELDQVVKMAEQVANDTSMDALTKMQLLLSNSHIGDENTKEIAVHLHLPANRELHEISNIQTVLRLSPILAKIVEQGNEEKVFNTKLPLETIQFLLSGSQFLMDSGLFDFSEQEIFERRIVMQEIIEKALSAKRGTFDFMNNNLSKGEKNE